MSPRKDQDDARIDAEARDWFVRVTDASATDAERAGLDQWRRLDPRHDAAFREYAVLWEETGELGELEYLVGADDAHIRAEEREATRLPWRYVTPVAATVAAMAAGVLVFVGAWALFARPGDQLHDFEATSQTRIAEIRDITLPDGSTVTLGGRSSIAVAFSDTERRVELVSGEAFFDVAPDKTWPFVVDAGATDVHVVGTKFEMRRGADAVRVAVVEGVVEVNHRTAPDAPTVEDAAPVDARAPVEQRILKAGDAILALNREPIAQPEPVGPTDPGAWREGRLHYVRTPLSEVIADANRYSRRPIELRGDLDALLVTASFRTDRIDELVETLAASLPVEADASARDRIILRPREG